MVNVIRSYDNWYVEPMIKQPAEDKLTKKLVARFNIRHYRHRWIKSIVFIRANKILVSKVISETTISEQIGRKNNL